MGFIAGAYSATWGGVRLGQTDDGFEMDYGATVQDITTDTFRARQDGVYQGLDMTVRFVLNEVNLDGVKSIAWPWHSTIVGDVGQIGTLMSGLVKPLVLTACPNTTAAADFGSITFTNAVVYGDRVNTKFAAEHRKISLSVAIFPEPSGSTTGSVMDCTGGTLYSIT